MLTRIASTPFEAECTTNAIGKAKLGDDGLVDVRFPGVLASQYKTEPAVNAEVFT